MTLHAIVAALGGDLYRGGRRANVPAPGHSEADRSVSLLLRGDRVVVHGFGAVGWRDIVDDLRARGLIDAGNRVRDAPGLCGPSRPPGPTLMQRRAAALRLWAESVPISPATPSFRHLRLRLVEQAAGSDNLRHHSAAPLSVYRPGRRAAPALVARISDADDILTAVELTYLNMNGHRASHLRLSRKTVGVVPTGSAVRLWPADDDLLVGEGVATVASASARFARPGWALLSAGNLARWSTPPSVRRLLIAADAGQAGEAAAVRLLASQRLAGVRVELALPAAPYGDWNEAEAGLRGR